MKAAVRFAFVLIASVAVTFADAWANRLVVGTCTTARKPFVTIQSALNAANPAGGDTVAICPGTYPEQLTIGFPVTVTGLSSATSSAPVITAPGALSPTQGNIVAHVGVINGASVSISNLTIDSAGNGVVCGSGNFLFGIAYLNSSSGSVKGVATRNQMGGTPPNTCGIGIGVGIFFGSNVTVGSCVMELFDFGAVFAYGAGTVANVQNNMIMGQGLASGGYNLISMYDGTTGWVSGNHLINLDSSAPVNSPIGSCGIALQKNSAPVTVSNNMVGNTQCGLALYASDGNAITGNRIFGSQMSDGIYICGNNNTVSNNTIGMSAVAGVQIDPSCFGLGANGNSVQNNVINQTCAGILVNPTATLNTIDPNTILNATITESTAYSCP
jgi:parallel beta-helix repeat protein